jgi:fatty-acyl-CoA synthase
VILVTINPAYRAAELAYTLNQSDAVALFMTDRFKSSDYYAIFVETCPEAGVMHLGAVKSPAFPKLRHVVALKPNAPEGYLTWEAMVNAGRSVDDGRLAAATALPKAGDPINIQYTSGTTGYPKAAMLTHRNILMNGWYVTGCQSITEQDRMCIPVPYYHCFGCVMGTLGAVTRGATMVIPAEYFDPAKTLHALKAEACTTLYGVPTMFIAMLEHADFVPGGYPALRSGIMAGSPCPIEIMKRVASEMGASEITIAYGQTETAPVITQTRVDDPLACRVETVGRPLPGVEAKIICADTGRDCADGEQGELCARGHGVMLGYYKDEASTEKNRLPDGWWRTGDLATRRPDGNYRITGRIREMICRGGENIYPREIEEYLFTHPAIEQVSIFGVPDEKFGEAVAAWVQVKHGHNLTEEEVRSFCRAKLAHYKCPAYVWFVEEFPQTVSGKIQKFKMRDAVIEKLKLRIQETA